MPRKCYNSQLSPPHRLVLTGADRFNGNCESQVAELHD